MFLVALLTAAVCHAITLPFSDVILPPKMVTSRRYSVGTFFLPGAQIPARDYTSLFTKLHHQTQKVSLSVAVPLFSFLGNIAIIPSMVQASIERVHAKLVAKGMPADAKFVLGGHSLGSVAAQEYVMAVKQRFLNSTFQPDASFFVGSRCCASTMALTIPLLG